MTTPQDIDFTEVDKEFDEKFTTMYGDFSGISRSGKLIGLKNYNIASQKCFQYEQIKSFLHSKLTKAVEEERKRFRAMIGEDEEVLIETEKLPYKITDEQGFDMLKQIIIRNDFRHELLSKLEKGT